MTDERERLPWFHCYPTLWLGVLQEMPPDLGYLYVVTCLRIYERRGPVPDDARALGRRVGFRESHARRLVDELVAMGKLQRVAGGLMNPFAERKMRDGEEIVSRTRKLRSAAAKISWEKRKQKQEPNDTPAKQKPAKLDLDSEVKKERGTPVGVPSDDWPSDFVEQFWRQYPEARRAAKKTVAAKLAAVRGRGEVTWARLMAGLARYNATDDVARGYACAPVVWINGGRWDDEIQPRGGSNAKSGSRGGGGFSSLAAQIRNAKPAVRDDGDASGGGGGDRPDGPPRDVARH